MGGYPPGEPAGHDMDLARRRLLELLATDGRVRTTVANDFADLDRWLDRSRLLVTYVAGPFPDETRNDALARGWRPAGAGWRCTAPAAARPCGWRHAEGRTRRMMVKGAHHRTLGCFFLNHPAAVPFLPGGVPRAIRWPTACRSASRSTTSCT